MKKIFRTTIFRLVVFFGFALYIKMFDANMAVGVSTWLGATTVTTSGEPIATTNTGTVDPVLSGINNIQATLLDMQTTLDTLVPTSTTTPVVTPTPVVNTTTTSSTGTK